ncbi:MAG: cytidylate kinase-like family protein [Oribacterium sp.]|nr:cytidylate kinase-like family protein [Oribacterium sp.]MBQ5330714.1 cytidylate kinase-like family protein [Oscillospiraceae bacterium]
MENTEKKTRIITVGRRFGSGGRLIAKAVAEKLGIPFFDKDIITNAAKESGLCDSFIEEFEQTPAQSMLFSLVMNMRNGQSYADKPVMLMAYEAQIEAVCRAAAGGECVIVGRCADYILRDDYDVASFFITASLDRRAQNVAKRENITVKEALTKINKMDRARASFHNYHAETRWGSSDSYEMCISTDRITDEQAAQQIISYLEMRK